MAKRIKGHLRPIFLIPIGIAAVSMSSILIRFAQDFASSLAIAAFRLLFAVLIILPFVLLKYHKELGSFSKPDLLYTLLSGLLLAIHFASWITSLEYTSVASSVVLVSTTPLWVAAASPLLLNERVEERVWWGLLITLIGGLLIAFSDSWIKSGGWTGLSLQNLSAANTLQGDLLAVLGAVSGAGYLLIGRSLRRKYSLLPYIFLVYGTAAVLLILSVLLLEGVPPVFPPKVYFWLILMAVFPQLIGHSIFNWALRYLPAGYVSVTLLGEPLGSTILAYIILREIPNQHKIIGAILILSGIMVASLSQKKPN
jgi:drug/metabolite transporter (DMT)-like permease